MNKHLLPVKTTLFRNKLSKILENIQRARGVNDLQTQEAYTSEAIKILATFYRTISETNFIPEQVRRGTSPDLETYNNNLQQIADDFDLVFLELENLEGVVLEQFNLFATHSNRLSSRVKRLGSRVTDFSLFSKLPIKNSIFFTDSFSNLSKVDIGSSLLNASECLINQEEGIITLPVNAAATEVLKVNLPPLINVNSNGRPGNNEERSAVLNNNIRAMLDDNPDTWFEYERVVRSDDQTPLVLDFTVNLEELEIINFIRINPNNFGARTEIEVLDISTSRDGQLYVSIKDDIPITGFFVEDEENVFKLAPSTSKFAGQGLYTFTPRFAKYIRVVLRQSTPYTINTVSGRQLRYAIGIRDFEIKRLGYESIGELVSAPLEVLDEVKKIALQVNQKPIERSELASVRHQISVDNGNTWNDISPLTERGFINVETQIPEVINVNTEDEDSIQTENPVLSIRYKAILERSDDGFTEGSSAFAEQIQETTELKSVPQSQPWFLELDNKPLLGSVSVIDPGYGSRGHIDTRYLVGKGTGTALTLSIPFDEIVNENQFMRLNRFNTFAVLLNGRLVLATSQEGQEAIASGKGKLINGTLPLSIMRSDLQKELVNDIWRVQENFIQRVFVDGEEWTRVPSFSGSQPDDKVYMLTPNNELRFGDGNAGSAPERDASIEMIFTPERLYPVHREDHTSEILFPTSIDRSRIQIIRRGPIITHLVRASQGSQIHRLDHRNIVIDDQHPIKFSPASQAVFDPTKRKVFNNGLISPNGELDEPGAWSIDTDRGILYSFTRVGDDQTITISYSYQTEETLLANQWDWGDTEALHHSVRIKENAWITNSFVGFTVPSGTRKIRLPKLAVIEGTLQAIPPVEIDEEDDPFLQEVPFLDGSTELSQVVRREQEIPNLVPVGPSQVASFTLNTPITLNTDLNVGFDNLAVFANEVANLGSVTTLGDYFVDRATGTITVHTAGESIQTPGHIHYWSDDPEAIPNGAYSVNYFRGEVFLQRPIPEDGYRINFEHVDYFIRYNIAREVPTEDWVLDPSAGTIAIQGNETVSKATITIKPNEVLKRGRTSVLQGEGVFTPVVYQINYQYIGSVRQNIEELAPYFSPVLKDYALQVVTKGFI